MDSRELVEETIKSIVSFLATAVGKYDLIENHLEQITDVMLYLLLLVVVGLVLVICFKVWRKLRSRVN